MTWIVPYTPTFDFAPALTHREKRDLLAALDPADSWDYVAIGHQMNAAFVAAAQRSAGQPFDTVFASAIEAARDVITQHLKSPRGTADIVTRASTVTDTLREHWEPWAHYLRAFDQAGTDVERALMAGVLAMYIARRKWRLFASDAAVSRVLRADAQDHGSTVESAKRASLTTAIFLVMGEQTRTQDHVFDRRKQRNIIPRRLPIETFCQWVKDEVIKAAKAGLRDEPYPSVKGDALDLASRLDGAYKGDDSPLVFLLQAEEHEEARVRLQSVLVEATPRQRQLLTLLHEGTSLPEAAAAPGIAASTARVLLYKLRRSA